MPSDAGALLHRRNRLLFAVGAALGRGPAERPPGAESADTHSTGGGGSGGTTSLPSSSASERIQRREAAGCPGRARARARARRAEPAGRAATREEEARGRRRRWRDRELVVDDRERIGVVVERRRRPVHAQSRVHLAARRVVQQLRRLDVHEPRRLHRRLGHGALRLSADDRRLLAPRPGLFERRACRPMRRRRLHRRRRPPACNGKPSSDTYPASGSCVATRGRARMRLSTDGHRLQHRLEGLRGRLVSGAAHQPSSAACNSPPRSTDIAGASTIVYGRVFARRASPINRASTIPTRASLASSVSENPGRAAEHLDLDRGDAEPHLYGPASPSYEAANDEYQATLVVAGAPGSTKAYAYRFSGDGGQTWTYCDAGDAGSSDGFTTPGVLTVAAPYFSQYIEGSGNNQAIEIYNPGTSAFSLTGCQLVDDLFELATSEPRTSTPRRPHRDEHRSRRRLPGALQHRLRPRRHGQLRSEGRQRELERQRCARARVQRHDPRRLRPDRGSTPAPRGGGRGNLATTDHTLLRICTTVAGDLNGMDAFDPATQWQGYAKDTSFLGSRNCPLP